MVGRKKLSTRFMALMLTVIMLFTSMMTVKVNAEGAITSAIENSVFLKNAGKVAPVFTVVSTAFDFAGKIYDGVTLAQDAESGKGVEQFFVGLLGKKQDQKIEGIETSLKTMDGKIDSIAKDMEKLSADLATANNQLNTIITQLGSGIEDIKVALHSSVLQMQEWTTIYSQINNFYVKYGDVRTTLEIKVDTLNNRSADFDRFMEAVSKHSNGSSIELAISKLDISCLNYNSLTEEEKTLLDTEISFDGKTYTVYKYVKDYVDFVRAFLEDTYDEFGDGYSDDMYASLMNMANFILGKNWQNGNTGIGEIYYKLAIMGSSTSDEAHASYESFVAGVHYDFLLTAYVCSLSLKSQIEYLELTGGNISTINTLESYLDNVDDLIVQVLQYSDYEYEKCILEYDFNGFVPEGNNRYEDYLVYYGNSVNYVNLGVQTTIFATRSSLSYFGDPTVSNQYMHLAAGETAQLKIWFHGKEIQGNYKFFTSNDCIVVNEDGTVAALHPGSATISIMVNGVICDIAQVTVSSSYAKYNGSGTNTWVYYKNGVKQTFACAGDGYEYYYSAEVFSTSGATAIDTSSNQNMVLTDYITFTDGASLEDYEVVLNHKYGQIQESDEFYLQFAHPSAGSVSLVKEMGNQISVIVIPIINGDRVAKRTTSVEITQTQKDENNTIYIYTKEDLLNWKAQYDTNYTSNKVNVVLMADIDFEWEEWTGIKYALVKKDVTAGTPDEKYNTPRYQKYDVTTYTFDGNGYTIKNITFGPVKDTVTSRQEVEEKNGKDTVKKTKYVEETVVTYGFFSKLAGEVKNLTIENVAYTGYPTYRSYSNGDWTHNSVTYDIDWPRVASVFAALADSNLTYYKNESGKLVETPAKWTCSVKNCVVNGSSGLATNYDMNYDPFGGLVDIKENTGHKVSVSNCVYGMEFIANTPVSYLTLPNSVGWTVSIFNTSQSNLYAGNFVYDKFYTKAPKTCLVYIDGMTETERSTAKENVIALPNSSLPNSNHSDYVITEAEYYDSEFWIDREWNADSVERMYIDGSDPEYRGDFFVDVSNLKMHYFLNEALDTEKLVVYYKEQQLQTNEFSVSVLEGTDTVGVKTVKVTYSPVINMTYTATFEVEYVGFAPYKFTYDGTTYTYYAAIGHEVALPDILFRRTDGNRQVGWFLQGTEDDESKRLTLGESVTITGEDIYVPAWKEGEIVRVEFGSIVYEVPEGTVITVPPIEYNPKTHSNPNWICKNIRLRPGLTYTVNKSHAVDGKIVFKKSLMTGGNAPYEISIHFQNLEDDDYTFMGTYENTSSHTFPFSNLYPRAVSDLTGMTIPNYSNSDGIIVKAEAVNCGYDKLSWDHHVIDGNGDTSHVTIWVNRYVYDVTWKDIEGNILKTESLRWGAMPISPTGEEVGLFGYTLAWDAELSVITQDTQYTLTEKIPKDGISYTVNHMWQNLNDDGYTLYESESLTGTTEADAIAIAKDYVGFTVKTIEEKTIAGDGSTVVNIYYNRNEYTVIWDIEGTLTTETYRYGATPSWKGETPTKQTDGKYNYTFKSWGDIQEVTDNMTYTAQFDGHLNTFTITWDWDGVTTTEVYTWGDIPEYKGEIPTRDATVQYTYIFKDWGEITAVTGDKTYTANFDAILNKYTITWVVEGDSFEEKYEYGETPSYKGTTPMKPSDETGSYIFNGWGPMETVTGDATYTAQFASVAST